MITPGGSRRLSPRLGVNGWQFRRMVWLGRTPKAWRYSTANRLGLWKPHR